VTVLNLAFLVIGIALIAVGWSRARGPWARYQALRNEDANAARYEAWRGGIRSHEPSGASVAMQILRRQYQVGAFILGVGVVLVFVGFFVH
jgi:hypothetical protein